MVTAFMTSFYMFRLLFMTFFGQERLTHEAKHHLHESPPSMTVPLIVLAVLSVIGGWVNLPIIANGQRLRHWLEPALGAVHEAAEQGAHTRLELTLMVASVLVALAGLLVAWVFYVKSPGMPQRLASSFKGLYRAVLNKWYVDEAYDYAIVPPARRRLAVPVAHLGHVGDRRHGEPRGSDRERQPARCCGCSRPGMSARTRSGS
jgi:NADH-quinone oxidoreductase subunit L